MMRRMRKAGTGAALALTLAACSGGGGLQPPVLSGTGPDEFLVLPSKPLETPASFGELPAPDPEGGNLVDPTPRADAVAALGGNPARIGGQGIPAADSALLAHAGRFGVPDGIRADLAAADSAFRHRGGGLLNLLSRSRYANAYRRWALDAWAELERLRAAGIRVPSAPPRP